MIFPPVRRWNPLSCFLLVHVTTWNCFSSCLPSSSVSRPICVGLVDTHSNVIVSSLKYSHETWVCYYSVNFTWMVYSDAVWACCYPMLMLPVAQHQKTSGLSLSGHPTAPNKDNLLGASVQTALTNYLGVLMIYSRSWACRASCSPP